MKNTTLTLTFNTERLDALAYHMGKKEADLKEELSDYLQKMYENMCRRPPGSTWMIRLPGGSGKAGQAETARQKRAM